MKYKISIKSAGVKYVVPEEDIKKHEIRKKIELYEDNKHLRDLLDLDDLDRDKGNDSD